MKASEWYSIHIFIHDFQSHDLFIKKFLTPFIQKSGAIERHFFIRYWQGGPHIRFRFQTENSQTIYKEIQQMIAAFEKEYQPKIALTADMFYANHKFDGSQPAEDELYWMEDLSAHFIPYHPELERYGNAEQLKLNEQLFEHSSILSEELIQQLPENHLLLKLLISCRLFQQVEDFLIAQQHEPVGNLYEEFWSFQKNPTVDYVKICQLLDNLENRFDSSQLLEPLAKRYGRKIKELVATLNDKTDPMFFRYMMMSQIHMFNNRMGLPPEFEHLLGVRSIAGKEKRNEMVL